MMTAVLFVCTGNICRSPTADGMLRKLIKDANLSDITVDSCGMTGYHIGEKPDHRTCDIAKKRGLDLTHLKARRIEREDIDQFDLLLAMDRGHLQEMKAFFPTEKHHKLALFMSFADGENARDVPDPYYGGIKGFDDVFDMVEEGCLALLDSLNTQTPSF